LSSRVIVEKYNYKGDFVFSWDGEKIYFDDEKIIIKKDWFIHDVSVGLFTFQRGDLLTEVFFFNKWYNAYMVERDGKLKGWYINLSKPAVFEDNKIIYTDLILDLVVDSEGNFEVLDEDEYEKIKAEIPDFVQYNIDYTLKFLVNILNDKNIDFLYELIE